MAYCCHTSVGDAVSDATAFSLTLQCVTIASDSVFSSLCSADTQSDVTAAVVAAIKYLNSQLARLHSSVALVHVLCCLLSARPI